jgi:hypothetical protein
MFLVNWLSDSKRLASSRDGFAAISDVDGKVTAEFGSPVKDDRSRSSKDWPKSDLGNQFGSSMPHGKRLDLDHSKYVGDWGEDAAFSPDGSWFGPLKSGDGQMDFLSDDGKKIQIKMPDGVEDLGQQAIWSPEGSYVLLVGVRNGGAALLDMAARTARRLMDVAPIPSIAGWSYRKARWSPWSHDGQFMVFVRNGQIWMARPDGAEARQLTFDNSKKVFPTFSRDGKRVAYVTYQPDDRLHYTRLGPTDLWVVDVDTTIAARMTAPNSDRINSLDWLDDATVVFDRVDESTYGYKSTLRRTSLR